jgi:hypothetical protein
MALKYANAPNLPNKNLEMSKCYMNTSTNPCVKNSVGDPIPTLEARTGTEDETTLRGMQRNEKLYAEACATNEEFIKSKFQTPRIPPVVNVPSLLLASTRPITKPLQEQAIRTENTTRQSNSLPCASATTPIGAIEPSSGVFVSNRVKDYLPLPILAPPCPTAVPTYFLASVRLIVASNERTPSVSPLDMTIWIRQQPNITQRSSVSTFLTGSVNCFSPSKEPLLSFANHRNSKPCFATIRTGHYSKTSLSMESICLPSATFQPIQLVWPNTSPCLTMAITKLAKTIKMR